MPSILAFLFLYHKHHIRIIVSFHLDERGLYNQKETLVHLRWIQPWVPEGYDENRSVLDQDPIARAALL